MCLLNVIGAIRKVSQAALDITLHSLSMGYIRYLWAILWMKPAKTKRKREWILEGGSSVRPTNYGKAHPFTE